MNFLTVPWTVFPNIAIACACNLFTFYTQQFEIATAYKRDQQQTNTECTNILSLIFFEGEAHHRSSTSCPCRPHKNSIHYSVGPAPAPIHWLRVWTWLSIGVRSIEDIVLTPLRPVRKDGVGGWVLKAQSSKHMPRLSHFGLKHEWHGPTHFMQYGE